MMPSSVTTGDRQARHRAGLRHVRGWEVAVQTAPFLVVTDDTEPAEIAQAIVFVNDYAKHQLHHPDCVAYVTAHARIDALLTDYQARTCRAGG